MVAKPLWGKSIGLQACAEPRVRQCPGDSPSYRQSEMTSTGIGERNLASLSFISTRCWTTSMRQERPITIEQERVVALLNVLDDLRVSAGLLQDFAHEEVKYLAVEFDDTGLGLSE